MNYIKEVKEKLAIYSRKDILITFHAKEQAIFRNIDIEEVKDNLISPERLAYAEKQKARKSKEKKYDCYFSYNKFKCHRYVIVMNKKCVICTINQHQN